MAKKADKKKREQQKKRQRKGQAEQNTALTVNGAATNPPTCESTSLTTTSSLAQSLQQTVLKDPATAVAPSPCSGAKLSTTPSPHDNEPLLVLSPSATPGAGTGLFATREIPAGVEAAALCQFVTALDTEALPFVCEWCFFTLPAWALRVKSWLNPQVKPKQAALLGNSNERVDSAEGDDGVRQIKSEDLIGGFDVVEADMLAEANETMLRCAACKTARYCSAACQKTAWKRWHRWECKVMIDFGTDNYVKLSEQSRVMVRLSLMKRNKVLTAAEWLQVWTLEDHFEMQKTRTPKELEEMAGLVYRIVPGTGLSLYDMMRLCCKIQVNKGRILLSIGQSVGVWLDPFVSMINHNCEPNLLAPFFDAGKLKIRSRKTIRAGDEVKFSYVSTNDGFLRRRRALHHGWFFDCSCERCIREQNTLKTQLRIGGGMSKLVKEQETAIALCDVEHRLWRVTAQNELRKLTKDAEYLLLEYPNNMAPAPDLFYVLAKKHNELRLRSDAVKYALQCIFTDNDATPFVISGWEVLVKSWITWLVEPLNLVLDDYHSEMPPLAKFETLCVFRRYLSEWLRRAERIYGAESAYVVGHKKWVEQLEDNVVRLNSSTEQQLFQQGQSKLLKWAGLPEEMGLEAL